MRKPAVLYLLVLSLSMAGCGGDNSFSKSDLEQAFLAIDGPEDGLIDRPSTFRIRAGRVRENDGLAGDPDVLRILEKAGYVHIEDMGDGSFKLTMTDRGREHCKNEYGNTWSVAIREPYVKSVNKIIRDDDSKRFEVVYTEAYRPASPLAEELEAALGWGERSRQDRQFKVLICKWGPDQVWSVRRKERYHPGAG